MSGRLDHAAAAGHRDHATLSAAPAASPFHRPRLLSDEERALWRERSEASHLAKQAATLGQVAPLHEINTPFFDPMKLMKQRMRRDLNALSLFSGGGGLDLGFDRAGIGHVASYEILPAAAATLRAARPNWNVYGGEEGDVRGVDWRKLRAGTDIVHGGPPCQPFSIAGRQRGESDERDMWPEFVSCVLSTRPRAFVAENVPALASLKFKNYVHANIVEPLSRRYHIVSFTLRAENFGVPQTRRRVFFVGFSRQRDMRRFREPVPTHQWSDAPDTELPMCTAAREALGLADIGFDTLCPTIRSTLTGPRHTTSILNSTAAQAVFSRLQIWPNGVAPTRAAARAFPARNGHFRLSVADVGLLQGFPQTWKFSGATYMQLGQIGNAVPPPLAYAVASSVSAALA